MYVYAFEEWIVYEGRNIGACWSGMGKVFEKKLLKLFVCHLFDGFWKAEEKVEFVEVRVAHIRASRSKVSFGELEI